MGKVDVVEVADESLRVGLGQLFQEFRVREASFGRFRDSVAFQAEVLQVFGQGASAFQT